MSVKFVWLSVPKGKARVAGRVNASLVGHLQHLPQSGKGEGVRCLGSHQPFARQSAVGRKAILGHEIRLVARQGSDGIAMRKAYGNVAADDVLGDKRSHGVVNKDDCLGLAHRPGQIIDAIAGRSKACLAGMDYSVELFYSSTLGFSADKLFPFGHTDEAYLVDERMPLKGSHRVQKHRLPVYLHELLRNNRVHPLACPACQDECNVVTLLHMAHNFW